jgi:hypothetical protein
MKFSLLLFILHFKLTRAAKTNASFKKFIKDKCLKFGIKTVDGSRGRLFVFNKGAVSSRACNPEAPDSAMVWVDAHTGFQVMASGNDEAAVAALTERKLLVEGDFKEFMWFSRALDIMMGRA